MLGYNPKTWFEVFNTDETKKPATYKITGFYTFIIVEVLNSNCFIHHLHSLANN